MTEQTPDQEMENLDCGDPFCICALVKALPLKLTDQPLESTNDKGRCKDRLKENETLKSKKTNA